MRKQHAKRWTALVLTLVMALGLAVPAMGAMPMMTPGETIAETPAIDGLGTMPSHSHSPAVADTPAVEEDDPADILATAPVQTWTTTDPSNTFFTVSCDIQELQPTSYEGVNYTKNAKLTTGKDITFTVPADQTGTFKMLIKTRAKTTNEANFNLDGTAVPIPTTGVYLYTNANLTAGKHTISRAKKEADVYMLVWEPDHICEWDAGTTTPATCTVDGQILYKCTVPGCTKTKVTVLPATGHKEATRPGKAATCVDDGYTAEIYCSVCNTILTAKTVIKATGEHTRGTGANANKCTVCGKDLPAIHEHVWGALGTGTVTKEPTCTETGIERVGCTVDAKCDVTHELEVPALGHHKVQVPEKAPVCAPDGYAAYEYCDREGCDYTTKTVTPHDLDANGVCKVCHQMIAKPLTGAGGWFEAMYVETDQFSATDVTAVSWSGHMAGELDEDGLEFLVRTVNGKTRIDVPGVPSGTYKLTVTAGGVNYGAENVVVKAYDRSGYAHWNYSEGVGAYRDDGLLKEDAIVLYVTEENKNTVTLTAPDGTTVTGIGHILNSAGADVGGGLTSKGGKANNNKDILKKLADNNIPLVVRIVGDVKSVHPAPKVGGIDGLTDYDSLDNGGSLGDNGGMARMKSGKNITIEGIGTDACINGWGFHFMASKSDPAAGRGLGFEVRNVAFRNVPEDCIGLEGQYESSTLYPVQRGWVHNCSFYAPTISPCAESDKDGGDGACDFKRGLYFTMDYCYYEGYHKTNLVGSGDSDAAGPQYHITWHHNYYKGCDSRGPLARKANMHIYNCIWDGQTSYVMDPRVNTYIFSEYNAFIGCKAPMRAGAIKSYNDAFSSCYDDQLGTIVTDKSQKVSSANTYASFELDSKLSYIPAMDYQLDASQSAARGKILAYCGPMKAQLVEPEDVGDMVPPERMPSASVVLPFDKDLNKTTVTSANCTVENVKFNLAAAPSGSTEIRLGKTAVGQDIVFKVDEAVDITIADGGATTSCILVDQDGKGRLIGSGTATNCPAGVYYIQPNGLTKGVYKEAKITHLTIKKTASAAPREHTFTPWTETVAPTCLKVGTEIRTCTGCGTVERRDIPMKAHNYVGGECEWCHVLEGTYDSDTPGGETIPVESLTLDTTTVTLLQNDTNGQRVVATVLPAHASNKKVTWKSADTSIAIVAANGLIKPTGTKSGTTTVTATCGGITKTVNVTIVPVSTKTYTFAATQDGPAKVAGGSAADEAITAGTTTGTEGYFTSTGSNKWKAKDAGKSDYSTRALLTGTGEGGGLQFTVSPGATAKVTINYMSTSSSNRSAIAVKDASGKRVANTTGDTVESHVGNTTASVVYDLGEGTYTIVSPKNVTEADVDYSGTFKPASDPNNPNLRGVEIIRVAVVETTVASGDTVAVESVTLNRTSAEVEVGQNVTLIATVHPDNATFRTVTWTTSNNSVATVSMGTVTARGEGTATITAACGGKSASATITVKPKTVLPTLVERITINGHNIVTVDATKDTQVNLTATVLPEDADNQTLSWSSDSVAKGVSVDSHGRVTVSSEAQACTATITAAATDGSGVKATYQINVRKVNVDSVTIKKDGVAVGSALTVKMGETLTLTADVAISGIPSDEVTVTDRSVEWKASNPLMATVSSTGVVTLLKAGTSTITATSTKDTTKSASFELTIEKNKATLSITARNDGVTAKGGTINLNVDAPSGCHPTVTITPDNTGASVAPLAEGEWNWLATLPANSSDTDDVPYTVTASFAGNNNWDAADPVSITLYARHRGAKVIHIDSYSYGPQGGKVTLNRGDELNLSVNAHVEDDVGVVSDAVLTYAWSKDGQPLAGQTDKTLSLAAVEMTDGGVYTCTVNCTGAAALRAPSITVTVKPEVPSVPTQVTTTEGDGQVTVSWIAPADDGGEALGGYIVRITAPPSAVREVKLDAGKTSYTFPSLTNGMKYTFSVVAVNSSGESDAVIVTGQPEVGGTKKDILDGTSRDLGYRYVPNTGKLSVSAMRAEDLVWAAIYDADGRLCGIAKLTASNAERTLEKGAHLKLFWTNSSAAPQCDDKLVY